MYLPSKLWSCMAILTLSILLSIRVEAVYSRAPEAPNDGKSRSNAEQKQNSFTVLGCTTWWSHDAVGYHPAMYLFLENMTGHAVGGGEIPFQGRFTDLHNGEVTVAREYKRAPVRDHDRFAILLRGPR